MKSSNQKIESRIAIKSIRIGNFKSIKNLNLRLNQGVNVLVGPNGAGKSNILEAISFLFKASVKDKDKIPYMPHVPRYSSPKELFYMFNPENNIVLSVEFEYYSGKINMK